jgi:periplasmic divalent cation tolerance protein
MENTEFIIVFSSAGSLIEANQIAENLITSKLAACVSLIPGVTSHYCWKEKRGSSYEVLMMIKTLRKKFDALKDTIVELHSFEAPEVLMVPVANGSEHYLDWIRVALEGPCKEEE